jgi:ferredoxin
MELKGRRVLVCNCEGTMPLDGRALAKACGASIGEPATQLCRAELAKFREALKGGEPLIVGCTQEITVFDEQREDMPGAAPVAYVNIRETAGWSEEAGQATAKIAALLAAATVPSPTLRTVTMSSRGVALICGRDETAIELGRQLSDRLDITIMLDRPNDVPGQPRMDLPIVQGRIVRARGHLGAFELVVDDYALPAPSSRQSLKFGAPRNGAASRCDIIIDVTGGTPLFPAHEKREGYFHPDPGDPAAVMRAAFAAADLVGEFEKPIYVDYHPELCAHSRSKKTGCTRCLDACPTSAIAPAGDTVAFDPFVCAGCGTCGAVCPTGAADYRLPPAASLAERVRALLLAYRDAGGRDPILLLHDERHGAPLIDALARYGEGLPARVLPLSVHSITQCGIDTLAEALAFGAADLRLLVPERPREDLAPLAQQSGLCEAVVSGLGFEGGRVGLIQTDDPDTLGEVLRTLPARGGARPAAYRPAGTKRALAKLALQHLHDVAPAPVDNIALPPGAPFGSLQIDAAGCTLCLSCVPACPTGALRDDPDRPHLSFVEDACVQCGLCRATCPEKVIKLEPRLSFTSEAREPRTIKLEEPATCVRCGKPFGAKSSIDKIIAQLQGKHWMYGKSDMIDRIRMCADCRVIVQSETAIDPYAGAPRPAARTTEDYLKERERPDDGAAAGPDPGARTPHSK